MGNCCLRNTPPPTLEDTVEYTHAFVGDIYVVKVYDGDTITIATRILGRSDVLFRFSVRIAGIDCPELKSKNITEKKMAIIARDFVTNKILHKKITLQNIQNEKYGRILADVFVDGQSLSNMLLQQKLAVEYNGKTKITDWEQFYNESLTILQVEV